MCARGLGKGFGSLLPEDFDQSVMLGKDERVHKILIEDIKPDPKQPRRNFDQQAIDELASSIERYGILQPIVVTKINDQYVIIAGERRWRAAQKTKLTHVPALVRSIEELERLEIGLIENMQRVDLSPIEQAVSIARLTEQFNVSLQDVATRLGKAHTTVVNTVRLLQLPDFARHALENSKISEGHARAVLALKDNTSAQKKLVDSIVENKWSVRQAEAYVTRLKEVKTIPSKVVNNPHKSEQILSDKYGGIVRIRTGKNGGEVSFKFKTNKEFTQFLQRLN